MNEELIVIAGPCAVESREQINEIADQVREAGAHYLRAMIFKPRTNPKDFQGIGLEGLGWITEAKERTGMGLVTEVLDHTVLEEIVPYIDVLQIGSRNMQNQVLLNQAGEVMAEFPDKYVLIKRGNTSTMGEIKGAIRYLTDKGVNPENIWFCERGIQPSFTSCRNTFDINIIPLLKEEGYQGKVIGDPSHATGDPRLVIPIAKAAVAAGADGLEIEVHNHPEKALCDGAQSLLPEQFRELMGLVRAYQTFEAEYKK
tara:strand:- start:103 stop:873 length:771 start_codon:yes stop_codon:yes gene_type:complete